VVPRGKCHPGNDRDFAFAAGRHSVWAIAIGDLSLPGRGCAALVALDLVDNPPEVCNRAEIDVDLTFLATQVDLDARV